MAYPKLKTIERTVGWWIFKHTQYKQVPDGWRDLGGLPRKNVTFEQVGNAIITKWLEDSCPQCQSSLHAGQDTNTLIVFWWCPKCKWKTLPKKYDTPQSQEA